MTPGSQIVVITDASSKQLELNKTIIQEAKDREVCIHFFLSDSRASEDGIFKNIADETHGTYIDTYDDWHLNKFINAYSSCDHIW